MTICNYDVAGRLSHVAVPANNAAQKTKSQCLQQGYNTPEGKFVQFFSPLSLIPGFNPNWKENLKEWGITIGGKGGGMAGAGVSTGTELTTLKGVTKIASPLERLTGKLLAPFEEVAPFAMGGAAVGDVLLHVQCAIDPSAPLEGTPVGPK